MTNKTQDAIYDVKELGTAKTLVSTSGTFAYRHSSNSDTYSDEIAEIYISSSDYSLDSSSSTYKAVITINYTFKNEHGDSSDGWLFFKVSEGYFEVAKRNYIYRDSMYGTTSTSKSITVELDCKLDTNYLLWVDTTDGNFTPNSTVNISSCTVKIYTKTTTY